MSSDDTTQTPVNKGVTLDKILYILQKACATYGTKQLSEWNEAYVTAHNGYEAGSVLLNPDDQNSLWVSTIDHNEDDPSQNTGTWQALSTELLNKNTSLLRDSLASQTPVSSLITTEQAEKLYYPLVGGVLHGSLIVDKTFIRNKETLTQPLGAIYGESAEFFLQLANNPAQGKMFGRLVIRDQDGNEHIGVQIESDGIVTNGSDEALLTKKDAENLFILKSNYHPAPITDKATNLSISPAIPDGGELFITATYPQDDETITKPLGAQIGELDIEQIYLQLADNAASDQVYGRLGLVNKDGDRFQILETDEDGSIIPKEGYRVLEISNSSTTPMKLLAFQTTSNNTTPTISFPEAFSSSPMVYVTCGHGHFSIDDYWDVFYFASLQHNNKTDMSPAINHSSFSLSVGSSNGKIDHDYKLNVIAIGPA